MRWNIPFKIRKMKSIKKSVFDIKNSRTLSLCIVTHTTVKIGKILEVFHVDRRMNEGAVLTGAS